jgi:septal ring-binding cell division protein DamX
MSMAAFGMMYKDLVLEEAEALKKYVLRGTPAVPAPAEAASAAASAASAEALAAAELAASVANEAARVASQAEEVASAASAAASVAAAAPVASAAPQPAVTAASEPSAKTKTDKERKAEKAEAKADVKADASSDEAWVNDLPANGYVVQLAAMDTQEDMRSFQRSNAVYAKARILRARHKDTGKRYFILVAGPFETKTQADAFMQSNPLLSKGWLRSSKSMKTQFTKS